MSVFTRAVHHDPRTQYRSNRKKYRIDRIEKRKKAKTPLFGELSRSSRDSFESDSDSNESRDVRINSPKVAFANFRVFSRKSCQTFDSIDSIFLSIRSILCPRDVVDRPKLGPKDEDEENER